MADEKPDNDKIDPHAFTKHVIELAVAAKAASGGFDGLFSSLRKVKNELAPTAATIASMRRSVAQLQKSEESLADAQARMVASQRLRSQVDTSVTLLEKQLKDPALVAQRKKIRLDLVEAQKELEATDKAYNQAKRNVARRAEVVAGRRDQLAIDPAKVAKRVAIGAAAAVDATAVWGVKQSFNFNRTLIEANSNLDVRNKLLSSALDVQLRTGDSLDHIADIMKVIRAQGGLYKDDLVATAATASKLQQGLGASTQEIGVLLNASRALGVSFDSVADSVANVVNKTSLSVGDVVDIDKTLRTTLLSYNRSGAGFGAVTEKISALEQGLRDAGAEAGGALRILKPFADMRQKGGLGLAFGTGGPDFLKDPARVDKFTKSLVAFLKPFRDNQWVFPQMAESFGLAADDAQALIRSTEITRKTEAELASDRKTLEEKNREQAIKSGAIYGQLLNNIKSLVVTGLTPLSQAVDWLDRKLTEFRSTTLSTLPDWGKLTIEIGGGLLALTAFSFTVFKAVRWIKLISAALQAMVALGGLKSVVPKVLTETAEIAAIKQLGKAAASVASGGIAYTAGTVAAMVVAALPLILVSSAAYTLWKLYQSYAQPLIDKNEEEMGRMRNKLTVGDQLKSVAIGARKALDNDNGVTAAKDFIRTVQADRQVFMSAVRGGEANAGSRLVTGEQELKDQLKARIETQQATIVRDAHTATLQERQDMVDGLKALQKALDTLLRLTSDDTDTAKKIAEEKRRAAQAAAEKQQKETRVQSVMVAGMHPRFVR